VCVYIVCVVSFSRYDIARLVPIFLSVLLMALAGIPFGMILKRTLVLAFCLLAAFERHPGPRGYVPAGRQSCKLWVVSFFTILFRTHCGGGGAHLVAVTTLPELTAQLRRLRIPGILVSLLK
jgi:hypothetical protein